MKQLKVFNTILIVLLLTGCATIRLVAPYDQITDQKVSDMQEQVVTKFTEWERNIPPLAEEQSFYDQTESVLEILILRNQNIEKSAILVEMLQKIQENMQIIKELHQANELSTEVIQQIKPDLMAQFNAIQKYQMALKRAEEN
ncbi:MAG: hypothetical protein K8R86_11480 [Bacteroidales bacterium]|nr:hypothetical protein [Bacteroidales bacterium]